MRSAGRPPRGRLDEGLGGELQRVWFALAIWADPRLLILDEPAVGLDVPSQRSFNPADMAFLAAWTLLFGAIAAWRYHADRLRPIG